MTFLFDKSLSSYYCMKIINNIQETSHTLLSKALDIDDQEAWAILLERYKKFIFHVLHKLNVPESDMDDLSQQCLLNLTSSLKSYDRSKGAFRSWLAKVITNNVRMHFRKDSTQKKYETKVFYDPNSPHFSNDNGIEKFIDEEWKGFVVELALESVRKNFSGKAIQVFELDMQDMTTSEISERTKLSTSSVYVLRNRVKQNLVMEIKAVIADMEK